MASYDLVIVGAGVMGCATAAAAAAQGHRVLLVDQDRPGSERGSSHGPSRIVRLAYGDRDYIPLAREALSAWEQLADEHGSSLLAGIGGLDLADGPGEATLAACAAAMTAERVPFERLAGAELRRLVPQLRPAAEAEGLFQPDTRTLRADRCVAALLARAQRHGADLLPGTAVTAVRPDGDGVQVQAGPSRVLADRVVIAAGAWTGGLVRELGVELPLDVRAEQVAVLEVAAPEDFAPERFPLVMHHRGAAPLVSLFPTVGVAGVKAMFDHDGPPIDPASPDRAPRAERLGDLVRYARSTFPAATGRVIDVRVCLYANTPDEDFIVDRLPEHPGVVVLSACSGHGFKFAPVLGHIAAQLALGDGPVSAPPRFSLGRATLARAAPALALSPEGTA